nr:hypothetical protein BaRGS_005762 [Batillaria attramentaria]
MKKDKTEAEVDAELETAVKCLVTAASQGPLCVVVDEVSNDLSRKFTKFCNELLKNTPGLRLWAAGATRGDRPSRLTEVLMTEALRTPPAVTREVQQSAVIEGYETVPDYTAGVPVRVAKSGDAGAVRDVALMAGPDQVVAQQDDLVAKKVQLAVKQLDKAGDVMTHLVSDLQHPPRLLQMFDLSQAVDVPTHRRGHTLDPVIYRERDGLFRSCSVHHALSSDHAAVMCYLDAAKPPHRPVFQTLDILNRNLPLVFLCGPPEVPMTEPLRTPPAVTRHVQQSDAIRGINWVRDYTAGPTPPPSDGPAPRVLHHTGQGHSEGSPVDCVECGKNVASVLRELHVETLTGEKTSVDQFCQNYPKECWLNQIINKHQGYNRLFPAKIFAWAVGGG